MVRRYVGYHYERANALKSKRLNRIKPNPLLLTRHTFLEAFTAVEAVGFDLYAGTGHCFNGLSCVASQTIRAEIRDGTAGNNSTRGSGASPT